MPELGRVMVTGAGGFIGGRIAEVLHCAGLAEVRAGVRRWSSAAQIARFPFEIALCDIMDRQQVRAAATGVRSIVHCARTADNADAVPGILHLLDTAVELGVSRFVYFSSVAVYGDAAGEIDDATEPRHGASPYGDMKLDTEKVCLEYAQRGLEVVVLRPSIVYGPFSDVWTTTYARQMASGTWAMPRQYCQGIANLVYVDDVVQAVLRALRSARGLGAACVINGPERPTWWQYFTALNDALGLRPLAPQSAEAAQVKARLMLPVRSAAKLAVRHFEGPIRRLAQRSAAAKALMKRAETTLRQTPTPEDFEFYSRKVSFSSARAKEFLGYVPAFSMKDGVALSAEWLKHSHYVPKSRREA
jgi:nucleoside-diphosphate-sugar epimerase